MNDRLKKKLIGAALIAIGLAIYVYDVYVFHRYGYHLNEFSGTIEEGMAIPFPTGEEPFFSIVPMPVYYLFFAVAGMVVLSLRFRSRPV